MSGKHADKGTADKGTVLLSAIKGVQFCSLISWRPQTEEPSPCLRLTHSRLCMSAGRGTSNCMGVRVRGCKKEVQPACKAWRAMSGDGCP